MSDLTISVKLTEDGSITIPREVVVELGLRPGDVVQVRLDASRSEQSTGEPTSLAESLKDLLEEAERLEPVPGVESSDPHEAAFGEILKEKYRRMGIEV